MGIYDRDYYRSGDQGWRLGGFETACAAFIAVNVAVFLVDSFIFNGDLSTWMSVRTETLLQPLTWWQFLTAGFAHHNENIWHLLGNMLAVFFFGREIEAHIGRRRFAAFYLTAILLGNIGFSIRHQLLGMPNHASIGASGAVVAIVIMFALLYPKRVVLLMMAIPIPAWLLGVIYVVSDFLGAFNPESRTAHDIHLIGAAYGFLYYKTHWDLGSLFPGKLPKFRSGKALQRVRIYDPDRNVEKLDQQADAILDKLHREGEASLTSKERHILEEYSRQIREKRR